MADNPALSDIEQALSQQPQAVSAAPTAPAINPALQDIQNAMLGVSRNEASPAAGPPAYDPGHQAARATTFGLSDKLAAAISGGASWLRGEGFSPAYEQEIERARREEQAFRNESPGGAAGLDVLGSLSTAPFMPAAAATLPGRIAQGMGIGAGIGAAQGFGASTTEPGRDTLTGAGVGAITGGTLPLALQAGAPLLRWFENKLPWMFPEATQQQAISAIAQRISQDQAAGGPGVGQMLAELQKTPNKPLSLTDVGGENLRGLAGNVARQPGPGRQMMKRLFSDRDEQAGARLIQDIDNGIASGGSAYDAIQRNLSQRSVDAGPLYEAMYERHPVVASDRIQQFINEPILQQGLASGIKLQRLEALAAGRPFDPNDYRITYDQSMTPRFEATPNLRTLDAAKRGLDDMLSGGAYRDDVSGRLTQMGRAIDQVRRSYISELDSLVPDYANARAAWAGPSRANEMIREGQSFRSMVPEEIRDMISRLSSSDREFFQLGIADSLRRDILRTATNADEAKKVINNAYIKQQLRPMFASESSYNDFVNNVAAERTMKEGAAPIIGGSQTAGRLAEDTQHGAGQMGNLAIGAGALALAEHVPHIALPVLAWRGVKAASDYLQQPNPAVREEIAGLLSRITLPENEEILQGIAGSRKPSYVLPRLTVPAASLAAGIYPGEISRRSVP